MTGETISFNYAAIQTEVVTGYSQTLRIYTSSSGLATCQQCSDFTGYTSTETKIKYQTYYLSSITASYNPTVSFSYEDRPDLTGDNRLVGISVFGIKQFRFNYYDIPDISHNMGRYFLNTLQEYKATGSIDPLKSKDYSFYYNDLQEVPLPISFSQDYLGYFNGKNNSYLIPNTYNTPVQDFSHRNPNSGYSRKGVLNKIKYPTGGSEEFFIEANTRSENRLRNTKMSEQIDGVGGITVFQTYNSPLIENVRTQNAIVQLWATDANANDGYTADPQHWTVKVDFYQGPNLIASRSSTGYTSDTMNVNMVAGLVYRWVMTVKTSTEIGHSSLYYDTSAVNIYDTVNAEIPGIRLKQIKYTDSISNNSFSKYYTFASLQNLSRSTGSAMGAVYNAGNEIRFYCGQWYELVANCAMSVYSSSGTDLAYGYTGSGTSIYYLSVIESDHPTFLNGGIEYQFYDNDPGANYVQVMGHEVNSVAAGQYPTLSGQLRKKLIFNSQKQILEEEDYIYETLNDISNAVVSIYVRSRYQTYRHLADRMDAFDVMRLLYINRWIRQQKVITRRYSNGEVSTNTTEYKYGTNVNVLPASEVTQNSLGVNIITENKYPTDFPNDPVMQKLVTKNILVPVIQLDEKRNGILNQKKIINYKDWFNNSKVLLPDTSKVKRSPSDQIRPELVVSKYDSIGNVLEVQKYNDIPYVYLWNKALNLPVCEVSNAKFEQVAYSSFEDEYNFGNWQVQSGGTVESSFIGFTSFTGSLQKSINILGKYTVSLWTNSSATVNGNAGTQVRIHRGWKLLQWTLTNPSTITVTGSNIDELRLYPKEASMVTYNYKRFVGIEASSDENCNVTYFEYDGFNRLYLVRDIDKNVLKKYCYNYAGKQEDCDFYSIAQSGSFTRNNCPVGYNGSTVTYTVPAGKYSSTISQADADQKALDDLNTNGQNYANTNGTCTQYICSTSNCGGLDKKCINNVCETAVRVNISSVWTKVDGVNWKWKCTWRYRWSDCSVSSDYIEYNDAACTVSGPCGAIEM